MSDFKKGGNTLLTAEVIQPFILYETYLSIVKRLILYLRILPLYCKEPTFILYKKQKKKKISDEDAWKRNAPHPSYYQIVS